MPTSDQSLFPTTRWTLIVELQGSEPRRMKALDELCRHYWLPIYGYIRGRGRSPEEAQDLTQAFFQQFLRKEGFDGVDGEKGRLRSYLRQAVEWFVKGEWRKAGAQKRGANVSMLAIDHDVAEEQLASISNAILSPEKAYDQRWARVLLEGVDVALRNEFEARGHLERHDELRKYLFWNSGNASYAAVAEKLEMSESSVRQAVSRMRKRYGEILRKHVAFTVERDADVEEEIRSLFAAFRTD